jgi:hypothetical protein
MPFLAANRLPYHGWPEMFRLFTQTPLFYLPDMKLVGTARQSAGQLSPQYADQPVLIKPAERRSTPGTPGKLCRSTANYPGAWQAYRRRKYRQTSLPTKNQSTTGNRLIFR